MTTDPLPWWARSEVLDATLAPRPDDPPPPPIARQPDPFVVIRIIIVVPA